MSGRACFTTTRECEFMATLLEQVSRIIFAVHPGYFRETISGNLIYHDTATQEETVVLDVDGVMRYVYVKAFQEAFPNEPYTPEQTLRINAIYDAIGHPEKKIPVY
jgi:hypothetical protein